MTLDSHNACYVNPVERGGRTPAAFRVSSGGIIPPFTATDASNQRKGNEVYGLPAGFLKRYIPRVAAGSP